jgi:3-hydroxyisobutyrate dehydrogenase-like beta-hydroxyacid dehydrogenase
MSESATPLSPSDGAISVIGLGRMGLPMARHLITAGYQVVGFDVAEARQQAARELGAEVVASAAEAARKSVAALVVVGFDDQVSEAVADPAGGLLAGAAEGFIVAICATVDSATSTSLDKVARDRGVIVVDATLCRGEPAADDATLLVMYGGPQATFERLDPVLSTVAQDVYRLGEVGAGQVGKMLNNYLLWNSVVANYEALRLGGRFGLDLTALRESLLLSSGNNWALETWLRSRPMPWAEKDMAIVMRHADEARLPMQSAGLVREEIKRIKVVKNAWTEGGGATSSMSDFTMTHL